MSLISRVFNRSNSLVKRSIAPTPTNRRAALEALEPRIVFSNTNFPLTLAPVQPLGSLVYQASATEVLAASSDTHTFSLAIDPQQSVSAVVAPSSKTFQPTVTLYAPNGNSLGSVTASAPGQDAVIPAVFSSTGGAYQIVVTGAGSSSGGYNLTATLNALVVVPQNQGGPQNTTLATAAALDSDAITFIAHDDRMAALDTLNAAAPQTTAVDFFSFKLNQGESASATNFGLNSPVSPAQLTLEDGQGNVLALGANTTSVSNSINNFVAPATGTYYIAVSGDVGIQYNLVVTRGADFNNPTNQYPGAQDITATEQTGDSNQGGVLGFLSATDGADYYSISANAGDNLHSATSTPAGGPNEFDNALNPELLLFDPNGNLVAIAAGNASDGRNSVIDFTVPNGDAGVWTVSVTSDDGSQGEYGLLTTGATGALSDMVVSATDPASDATSDHPTTYTVTFNNTILATSLTAGEFEVNGVDATAVKLDSANTATWTLDPTSISTTNVITLGADAGGQQVEDISGVQLTPFSGTFFANSIPTPTMLTLSAGSGAGAYGGTTSASATLTSGGSPVSNETITFSLNGASVGMGTTDINGIATLSGISLAGYNAGTYASLLTANFAGDATFPPSNASANVIVSPATLTITAKPQSKVYGSPDPALTYGISGIQTGDTPATVLTGALSRNPGETVAGGPYAITQGTLAANSNYTIDFTASTLTITRATLTVTPNNVTRVVGAANPSFTYMIGGFVNGDTSAVVSGSPSLSVTATTTSPPGNYAITDTLHTLSAANYQFKLLTGVLSVVAVPFSASSKSISALEGRNFNGEVAALVSTTTSAPITEFSATINWGDGQTSAGVVDKDSAGHFHIDGNHAYALNGSYTVKVTIKDSDGFTDVITDTAKIADAPLDSNAGLTLTKSKNVTYTNLTLASFRDEDSLNTSPARYTGTIDWGDGSAKTSAKFVFTGSTFNSGSYWLVQGTHKYTKTGVFTVKMTVTDTGGASLLITGKITVS